MPLRVQHLIQTRFSVRTGSSPGFRSRAWLEERIDLFRCFCLPSVAAQTCQEFTWLLLCDESTEPEALAELRKHERALPFLRIVFTGQDRGPLSVLRSAADPDADVLITTRLDSDDALADRYVEAAQSYIDPFHRSPHSRLLVNFPRGYRLDLGSGKLYYGHMPNSPFHSLLERPQRAVPKTVLDGGHARLHQRFFTHQDESIDAWMIVVHGGNLINRIPKGARRAPFERPPGFALS